MALLAVASRWWSSAPSSRRAGPRSDHPALPRADHPGRDAAGARPGITAALASAIGHDLLFVEPVGSLTIARADEALGLVLLLFTALVISQLADPARRGAERAREAEVARHSDALKTALLRAVSHDLRTPLASIKASVSGAAPARRAVLRRGPRRAPGGDRGGGRPADAPGLRPARRLAAGGRRAASQTAARTIWPS